MTIVWKAAGLALAVCAVAFGACGGGGGDGQEGDIEQLVRDFTSALAAGDAERVAAFFSEDCTDVQEQAEFALGFIPEGADIEIEIESVDIENLTDDSADVLPHGVFRFEGEEEQLTEEGDEPTAIVREDGDWKIAECDFFAE